MAIKVPKNAHVHVVGDSLTAFGWYVPLEALASQASTVLPTPPVAATAGVGAVAATSGVGAVPAVSGANQAGPFASVTWTADGVPGIGIDGVAAAVNSMIVAFNPDALIIELGRNSTGSPTAESDAVSLISQVLAWKSTLPILWVGAIWAGENWSSPPPAWNNPSTDAAMDGVNAAIQTAIASFGLPDQIQYCPARQLVLPHEIASNPGNAALGILTSDGTHPNAAGQPIMSSVVLPSLEFLG